MKQIMRFHGRAIECAEVIAQLDADLGYPRGYTQADVDSGLVRCYGPGPHPPVESLRTETISHPVPVAVLTGPDGAPIVDANGQVIPTTPERVCRLPSHLLGAPHRARVARARVLRLLNRGTRAALMAVPGIGGTRADAIIARRAQGRMTSMEDVRDALPALAMQALRDYALTKAGDDDQDEAP